MKWLSLIFALAASAPSQAALRFGCGTVTIQRLDPLVEPGKSPSAHLHQIVGGNAFNATMSGDIGNQGTCTTCTFSEDFSNYWTAVMFFKHPTNGSYKRVPIMENDALPPGINGGMFRIMRLPSFKFTSTNIVLGMTVYYTQQDFYSNGNQKITAFKPVCDSVRRSTWRICKLLNKSLPGLSHDSRQPGDQQRRSEYLAEGS